MSHPQQTTFQSGFSAVELLITMFIAAAFIITGYQLYSIVIKNGGEARRQAKASNIAYDNLRRYSPQAVSPCAVVTPTPTPTIPANSGLGSAAISVTITCPYGTSSTTSKVESRVTYDSPQQEVVHAIYVTE
jgi:Tfp pilus assembly protein PilV